MRAPAECCGTTTDRVVERVPVWKRILIDRGVAYLLFIRAVTCGCRRFVPRRHDAPVQLRIKSLKSQRKLENGRIVSRKISATGSVRIPTSLNGLPLRNDGATTLRAGSFGSD